MALRPFRHAIVQAAPRWLQGRVGGGLLYAFGAVMDGLVDAARAAIKARQPGVEPDALDLIGRDRGLRRSPYETPETYAARLRVWRRAKARAGTPGELLRQVQAQLPAPLRVELRTDTGRRWTLLPDGTLTRENGLTWNWDGTSDWARFWILLYPTGQWTRSPTIGHGGTIGTDPTVGGIGSTLPAVDAARIRQIVAEWSSAHARCVSILVVFPDSGLPESLTAGNWDDWRNRNPLVHYWDGA